MLAGQKSRIFHGSALRLREMRFVYSEAQAPSFQRLGQSRAFLVSPLSINPTSFTYLQLIIPKYAIFCRDVSTVQPGVPLKNLGLISAHTRPVQCLVADAHSTSAATLFTADSMGAIKVWSLERTYGDSGGDPGCRATQKEDLQYHRTGVNDMWYGQGQLWTGMSN